MKATSCKTDIFSEAGATKPKLSGSKQTNTVKFKQIINEFYSMKTSVNFAIIISVKKLWRI